MIAKYISNFVSLQNVFTHLLILLRFYYYTMKIGFVIGAVNVNLLKHFLL